MADAPLIPEDSFRYTPEQTASIERLQTLTNQIMFGSGQIEVDGRINYGSVTQIKAMLKQKGFFNGDVTEGSVTPDMLTALSQFNDSHPENQDPSLKQSLGPNGKLISAADMDQLNKLAGLTTFERSPTLDMLKGMAHGVVHGLTFGAASGPNIDEAQKAGPWAHDGDVVGNGVGFIVSGVATAGVGAAARAVVTLGKVAKLEEGAVAARQALDAAKEAEGTTASARTVRAAERARDKAIRALEKAKAEVEAYTAKPASDAVGYAEKGADYIRSTVMAVPHALGKLIGTAATKIGGPAPDVVSAAGTAAKIGGRMAGVAGAALVGLGGKQASDDADVPANIEDNRTVVQGAEKCKQDALFGAPKTCDTIEPPQFTPPTPGAPLQRH